MEVYLSKLSFKYQEYIFVGDIIMDKSSTESDSETSK